MSQEKIDNLFASESWTAVYTAFSNISLKAYDFDNIREALLAYVKQTYPDKFNDFIASSEFIAILDLVSYLGHSLSFRNDMNTRENFLATAERRESILKIAKTLGYNKTRPINARGFMKITSVTTNQPITDNFGDSLANKTIFWNDGNNPDWYENFISVIDAALHTTSKIQDPIASLNIGTVENYLYEINENPNSNAVNYPIVANLAGKNRRFEAVRTKFEDGKIYEAEPDSAKRITIVNRNDNLGPASDRTGFFVFAKAGTLNFKNLRYTNKISNRIEILTEQNISNTDVWIQKVDTSGQYVSSVTKVDNDTRETAIYNSLRTGSGDLVSLTTIDNNGIELHFPDGVFGNAAYGDYRLWYRQVDNENFSVNRTDITDATITIPYEGDDGRIYNLGITLKSTADFSENYQGENYASVKRIAPRSYYSQDRMVNGQDYNVLPLSVGQNVVKKIKAVNTTFAGNSRFFEMDDVTGHHSNLSITGTDGSIYVDDDRVKMSLRFNRQNGKIDDFIRNEMTKVIKHDSLKNLYLYSTRGDSNSHLVLPLQDPVTNEVQNPIPITIDNSKRTTKLISTSTDSAAYDLTSGDYIKIELNNDNIVWAKIQSQEEPGKTYVLDRVVVGDDEGEITEIVKGFRTRFTDYEISTIKRNKIEDTDVTSFTIVYKESEVSPDTWVWYIHNEDIDDELVEGKDVFVTFKYKGSVRENEAEYVAEFTGKSIVFESAKQVKFYYGNTESVVDNETGLLERDKIVVNYSDGTDAVPTTQSPVVSHEIGVGHACSVTNVQFDATTECYTFEGSFKNTGAELTYAFLEKEEVDAKNLTYTATITSPVGTEYDVVYEPTIGPIGEASEYKGFYTLCETDLVGSVEEIGDFPTDDTITTYTLPESFTQYIDVEEFASGTPSYYTSTTMSEEVLKDTVGFKGKPNSDYFNEQVSATSPKFFWIDESALENPNTPENVSYTDTTPGVHKMTDVLETNGDFEFRFPTANLVDWIREDDTTLPVFDIYFKQLSYGEVAFASTESVTLSNLIVKDENDNIIENAHLELIDEGTDTYRIIFWTKDPGDTVNVSIATVGNVDLTTWKLTVKATFDLELKSNLKRAVYKDIESFIYDEFRTPTGSKVDPSKVKLTSISNDGNPYGVFDVFSEVSEDDQYNIIESKIVVAKKVNEDFEYTPLDVIASDYEPTSEGFTLWYNTSSDITDNSLRWHKNVGNTSWDVLSVSDYSDNNEDYTIVEVYGIEYKVLPGRTYVEDKFFSFRWDHYADMDKRIDPSTSNIIDIYVLTTDYVKNIERWARSGFSGFTPVAPNSYELKTIMSSITDKSMLSDHVSFIPVKFKYLFGDYADIESQATFKVVKKPGTVYTDSEIKTAVSSAVNEYFKIDNWDFGDTFYFSELAAYLHMSLPEHISSVLIAPKFSGNKFEKLLSITSGPNEIFYSVTTSKDVKIINSITDNELLGE